ncbi:hypothetical protein J1N35_019222 [Gossypium stocksii]|uniref:Uncharacterized protein n=1 Tax=Gossypium stocksii TaxID=47602 RepID=A0A9D3VRX7_9ROSI|nr:hypothetical protein J1N35_019222 [Gossypium stocksii]
MGKFHAKLCDLSNQTLALGEEYSNYRKKKKSLCVIWSDEDSTSIFKSNEDPLSNYVAFTTSVITISNVDNDKRGLYRRVCGVNAKLLQENTHMKKENTKLVNQVKTKQKSLLAEELNNLEKI